MSQLDDEQDIVIRVSPDVARLLRHARYILGEHQAAGVLIPTYGREESEKLGNFLSELDRSLGGTGRMA